MRDCGTLLQGLRGPTSKAVVKGLNLKDICMSWNVTVAVITHKCGVVNFFPTINLWENSWEMNGFLEHLVVVIHHL